ncbi:MAG: GxxExxY protein [Deltaproteobacteria bacterium]|nr:GxxExxY protein [Deltaproteobacteria bacterium]
MPATGPGNVFIPQDTTCSCHLRQVDTPLNKLSKEIIGTAIEVHKVLGPGLLESAYEECLCHELHLQNLSFERQKPLPVKY